MATGLLVQNTCYETLAEASNVYFSSIPVSYFPHPTNPQIKYFVKYEFVNPNWMRSIYAESPSLTVFQRQSIAPLPNFSPCLAPSESFNLGLQFGAAFVGTLIIAWGFLIAKKVLF